MPFNWLLLGGHQTQQRVVIEDRSAREPEVVGECYCLNGHSIITETACFQGHPAITLKLKGSGGEGLLALSPVLGDRDRIFIDFDRRVGDIVEICCPTCAEPFPVYNQCPCGAYLVALFTSPKARFSQCIGICQRLGCLHSELLSERDLRLYSREKYF